MYKLYSYTILCTYALQLKPFGSVRLFIYCFLKGCIKLKKGYSKDIQNVTKKY